MRSLYEIIHICTAVVLRVRIPLKPWFFLGFLFPIASIVNLLRWSLFTFIYNRTTNMNYFIETSHNFTAREDMNSINLASLAMCGFIAQLVEHRTGIAVSRRSRVRIPLKSWFFQASSFQLLKLEIFCDDHSSLSSTTAVQIWIISYKLLKLKIWFLMDSFSSPRIIAMYNFTKSNFFNAAAKDEELNMSVL